MWKKWPWHKVVYPGGQSAICIITVCIYSLISQAIVYWPLASYLMGYDTPMNFNKPFLSWNIKEFWNRWHMTLSFGSVITFTCA